jgi:uncharacterized protein Usg
MLPAPRGAGKARPSPAVQQSRDRMTSTHREGRNAHGALSKESVMTSMEARLRGYRLTTAQILYRMPDHPAMLQAFIWQDLDIAPRFPVLNKFLRFWETSLDGKLFQVRVAARGVIADAELTLAGGEFSLH